LILEVYQKRVDFSQKDNFCFVFLRPGRRIGPAAALVKKNLFALYAKDWQTIYYGVSSCQSIRFSLIMTSN